MFGFIGHFQMNEFGWTARYAPLQGVLVAVAEGDVAESLTLHGVLAAVTSVEALRNMPAWRVRAWAGLRTSRHTERLLEEQDGVSSVQLERAPGILGRERVLSRCVEVDAQRRLAAIHFYEDVCVTVGVRPCNGLSVERHREVFPALGLDHDYHLAHALLANNVVPDGFGFRAAECASAGQSKG